MNKTIFHWLLAICLAFSACGGNSSSGNYSPYPEPEPTPEPFPEPIPEPEPDPDPQPDSEQVFVCQICNGYGMAVYFDGSLIPCYGCGGTGVITKQQLQSVLDQLNSSGGYNNDNNNSGNNDAIEAEIERLEESIARKEQMLEETESYTMQTQLKQAITEERYKINQLKIQRGY